MGTEGGLKEVGQIKQTILVGRGVHLGHLDALAVEEWLGDVKVMDLYTLGRDSSINTGVNPLSKVLEDYDYGILVVPRCITLDSIEAVVDLMNRSLVSLDIVAATKEQDEASGRVTYNIEPLCLGVNKATFKGLAYDPGNGSPLPHAS